MTPCVGFNGDAFDGTAKSDDVTEERFFDNDHHDQHGERERRRHMMRQKNFAHALESQTDRGGENAERDKDRGERFGFAVTVGMRFVRRSRRKA